MITIHEIIQRNNERGDYFFNRERMETWGINVYADIFEYKNRFFFITSNRETKSENRFFWIWEAHEDGYISLAFTKSYKDFASAKKKMTNLQKAKK